MRTDFQDHTLASDTIAAIATPVGSCGIGVIRISGEDAVEVGSRVFSQTKGSLTDTPTHTARFGRMIAAGSADVIDQGVVTVFLRPHSYTGEDVVEISCHGGIAVLRAALAAVLAQGARLAEPGEFTKRAFLNGKLDLAQAEAVNDIIKAQAEGARKAAERQLEGELSRKVRSIAAKLVEVCSAVEAAIDFPDDVDEPDTAWLLEQLSGAASEVSALTGSFETGRILRDGLRVVIAGDVNVGKSSLLNALLRHARAIVSPIPGTTRDLIEDSLQIQGIPIVAVDTAGIRETTDPVEQMGVELALESVRRADLTLLVVDATKPCLSNIEVIRHGCSVVVVNKIDLVGPESVDEIREDVVEQIGCDVQVLLASAITGEGIEDIEKAIAAAAGDSSQEAAMVTNSRHQQALTGAAESINHAISALRAAVPIDLLSVDLAAARSQLGLVTGETATDDLLEAIFSNFCIGK